MKKHAALAVGIAALLLGTARLEAATLQSIAVTPANPSVAKGLTQQFTATGTFSDNSTQNLTAQVTWASATTAVATINSSGLATAIATGTSYDQRHAERRDRIDGVDGDGGGAAVDRGDAGQSRRSPRG